MKVTKELIENYRIAAYGEWASISLRCWTRQLAARTSEDVYCGEIAINSSLGAWGHVWTACSVPFKLFLTEVEFGYTFGKFLGNDLQEFDPDKTAQGLLESVIDARRSGDLTKEDARLLWDELIGLQHEPLQSVDDLVGRLEGIRCEAWGESPAVTGFLSEPWERARMRPKQGPVTFWRVLWPLFISTLKEELAGTEPTPAETVAAAERARMLAALERHDWETASIWRRYYPSATGDWVDLRELRKALKG